MDARKLEFLSRVVASKHVKPVKEKPIKRLSNDALSVLIQVGLRPGLTMTEISSFLDGLHPARRKKAVDELEARGLVIERPLVTRRGPPRKALEVTPEGRGELLSHGISPAEKLVGRGSWKHDVYARRYVKTYGESRSWQCIGFEKEFFDGSVKKVFDVAFRADGHIVGCEVICSGKASDNAEQLLKAASIKGIQRVIAFCEKKTDVQALDQRVRSGGAFGISGKIDVKSLSDYAPWSLDEGQSGSAQSE